MSTAPDTPSRTVRMPRSARRVQLLAAAQEVFVARGYHAAGMDEIAERAGVSKPVLYQHFPGKLELYLALLDQHAQALEHEVRAALASTHDNRARVEATMRAYFDFVGTDGAYRLVFESDLRNEPAARERVDSVLTASIEAIADVIAEDTGLTRDEAEMLSCGLAGMGEVSARWWLRGDAAVDKERAVQLLAALAWRGISGFPRTAGA